MSGHGGAGVVGHHPFASFTGEPLPPLVIVEESLNRSSDPVGLGGLLEGGGVS